mmetsp:Transcript_56623/g.143364  ORF Transcript_56623/g.143364 Transcript_56623/m.143364 type:complete len:533 (+) Transcript_56623:159-1757(+)
MVASLLAQSPDAGRQLLGTWGGSWHCQLCGNVTPPLVGSLVSAARHSCRSCSRTVCDDCSTLPLGGAARTCRACYLQRGDSCRSSERQREKYVFLVRHAQSTWNANVDLVKGCSGWSLRSLAASACSSSSGSSCLAGPSSLDGGLSANIGGAAGGSGGAPSLASPPGGQVSMKDLVARGIHMVAHDVWSRDHPISVVGERQAEVLRRKILARRTAAAADVQHGAVMGCLAEGFSPRESARERRYYDTFLAERQQIYCSPLLRALQTAQLAFPEEDGWGSITLLKDARERFRFVFERDCLGAGVGGSIADRAAAHLASSSAPPPDTGRHVDTSDCAQKWWSDDPETDEQLEARLKTLWRRLLDEDEDDSCVLVTHSNLIKALLMQFGDVDNEDSMWIGGAAAIAGLHDDREEEEEEVEDEDCSATWQVVHEGPEALRRLKVERLQNCGVLGLRCVLEGPRQETCDFEVDGWVDIDAYLRAAKGEEAAPTNSVVPTNDEHGSCEDRRGGIITRCGEAQWVAKDALLMFDSVLVQ